MIDKVVFTTKPYDIDAITKEAIEAGADGPMGFDFDDEFYTTSTPEEIDAFYRRHCTISNDDIPEEDDIPVYDQPNDTPAKVDVSNAAPQSPSDDISLDDLDVLASDSPDEKPEQAKEPAKAQSDDIDAESLIAGLDL